MAWAPPGGRRRHGAREAGEGEHVRRDARGDVLRDGAPDRVQEPRREGRVQRARLPARHIIAKAPEKSERKRA